MIVMMERELIQGLQQYEQAMIKLSVLLRIDKWTDVSIAFGIWSQQEPRCAYAWQTLYIEAKHYIAEHGIAPWYDSSCSYTYCTGVRDELD